MGKPTCKTGKATCGSGAGSSRIGRGSRGAGIGPVQDKDDQPATLAKAAANPGNATSRTAWMNFTGGPNEHHLRPVPTSRSARATSTDHPPSFTCRLPQLFECASSIPGQPEPSVPSPGMIHQRCPLTSPASDCGMRNVRQVVRRTLVSRSQAEEEFTTDGRGRRG